MLAAARRAPVEVFAEIVCPFTHIDARFVVEAAAGARAFYDTVLR